MISQRVRVLRLQLGISQSELARRAGYSHEFISQVERGLKTPSIKALQKIAGGLGVPPSLLMEGHNPKEEEMLENIRKEICALVEKLPGNKLKVVRELLLLLNNQD